VREAANFSSSSRACGGPAFLGHLLRAADGQSAVGNGARDAGAGADVGASADLDGRDQG